jgi:hypothetical protein
LTFVQVFRAPWSSASFLVYLGGLTILAAVGSLLEAQAGDYAAGGFAGWAFLIFLATTLAAFVARARERRVTAGLLALSSVASFVTFLGALLEWFGWLTDLGDSPLDGFRVSRLVLELAVVAAAVVALRVFRFPLLVFPVVAAGWLFVTDVLSNGGNWSAVVSLLVGLALLAYAVAVDGRGARPYGLWIHVGAGLAIGGALLWLFHDGDWDWILIAIGGVLYVAVGERLSRPSWAVLGAWGILQTAAHFAVKWSDASAYIFSAFYLFPFVLGDVFDETGERAQHAWAGPFVFAAAGALFLVLGLWIARRGRQAAL